MKEKPDPRKKERKMPKWACTRYFDRHNYNYKTVYQTKFVFLSAILWSETYAFLIGRIF